MDRKFENRFGLSKLHLRIGIGVPQPFDWADFLKLADELAGRQEEYCLRTAIGRAYSFVYHLARRRILDNNFIIVPGGDSHKQVWEKYDNSPEPECKKLYSMAKGLKEKRERADYNLSYARIEDDIPEVLDIARSFAERLHKLNPRLPVNKGVRP